MKGIIYYTDNRLNDSLYSIVQKYIKDSGLPISSSSLRPIDFGNNVVVSGERSYPTMVAQIIAALENSKAKYVFFCEHDVLYHKSHFEFNPLVDDIFYYNENVWRWWMESDSLVTYDRMLPLSCMCANREFALDHYKKRLKIIEEMGWDKVRSREPRWARRMGYEPGTKKKKRGGITDDDFDTWSSDFPIIDIRHRRTFSSPKITLKSFKHLPKNWREIDISKVPGWDLKGLFNNGS